MATSTSNPDPVLETQIFWDRYKREIAVVAAIFIAAGIAFTAYRFLEERREADAATALGSAKTADDYRGVISSYPKSAAAASAFLLAADELRKKQDFTGANAALQQFVDKFPNHPMATTARMAIASNIEAMGKPDEALATYRKIASSYPRDFLAPLAMLSQVRLLQAKGAIEEARTICGNVKDQYRESYFGAEAERTLRTVKPAPGPVAKPNPSTQSPAVPQPSPPPNASPAKPR